MDTSNEGGIPPFDPYGNLPPGMHWVTWGEFKVRFGADEVRQWLLQGLELAIPVFQGAGCKALYIDGSFVTSKLVPGDYDVCWEEEGTDVDLLDPILVKIDEGQASQKAKYRGEFWPAHFPTRTGEYTHLDFFQKDRKTGKRKGILAINIASFTG